MRKALIAVAVASALFAVGAFAASFAVQSEDIASGGNAVEACVEEVDIVFATPLPGASDGVWTVNEATVNFLPTGADHPCAGYTARLALGIGDNPPAATVTLAKGPSTVSSTGVATFPLTPAIDVATIQRASVVVNGKTLTADLP